MEELYRKKPLTKWEITHSWEIMDQNLMIHELFGSKLKILIQFLILDQKKISDFMIRIKKNKVIFWSGSKIFPSFYDPDQKFFIDFLIRIKNFSSIFWSGSKIFRRFFDPDQKIFIDFWIWIKKFSLIFWSGSKIFHRFFDPDQKKILEFLIRIMHFSWSGSTFMIQINKNFKIVFYFETRISEGDFDDDIVWWI